MGGGNNVNLRYDWRAGGAGFPVRGQLYCKLQRSASVITKAACRSSAFSKTTAFAHDIQLALRKRARRQACEERPHELMYRSEERRVGKESGSRCSPEHESKNRDSRERKST